MARQRFSDDDDDRDDDRDTRPRRSQRDEDEYESDDDRDTRSRRGRRDDYDYDDDDRREPVGKPGLAVAAGVMWCITGGIAAILSVFALIGLFAMVGLNAAGGGLSPASILGLFMIFGVAVFCLIAGIRTLAGNVSSVRGFGIGSIVFFGGYMVFDCINLLALSNVPVQMRGGVMGVIVGVLMLHFFLLGVGLLMPGIFALACASKYEKWWSRAKRRRDNR